MVSEEIKTDIHELTDEYYEQLHTKIFDYLINGNMHSTIVGITAVIDGDKSKNDLIEATRFADYIIDLLKKIN